MTHEKMNRYCNQWQPNYKLNDGEQQPENGSLQFNTTLQLTLFCYQFEKWHEVPYVGAFMTLYKDHNTTKKCGVKGDMLMPYIEETNKK